MLISDEAIRALRNMARVRLEDAAARSKTIIFRCDEAIAMLDEIARLRAELDRRPDISAEDARAFMMFKPVPARDSREGPVMHALRAHAAKAGNP